MQHIEKKKKFVCIRLHHRSENVFEAMQKFFDNPQNIIGVMDALYNFYVSGLY